MYSVFGVLLLVAASQAQYCVDCSSYASREDRMSCRMFCMLDATEDGTLTDKDFSNAWNSWGCSPDGCNESRWVTATQSTMQMCNNEMHASFNRLATMDSSSDATLLEASDMSEWEAKIIFVSGSPVADYAAFQDWFTIFYADVSDPGCGTGY